MNLKQLEYFLAVAETQSISLAARRIYVAQPTISRQIALLEEELGVELLLRTSRGIELTDAGRSLYQQSTELLLDVRRIKDSIRGAAGGVRGQLNLGTLYSNIPLLTEKLRQMRKLYPEIRIYVRQGSPDALVEDLRQRKLHLLLLRRTACDLSEFRTLSLAEDPLELIVPRALDPAPELAEVPIDRLREVPMCMLRADDVWGYNEFLASACRKRGFELRIACECYDTPMVMQMVQAGFGLSYQPRSIAMALNNPDVYAKPIQDFHVSSYPCLVWHGDGYLSGCMQRFLTLFEPAATSGI